MCAFVLRCYPARCCPARCRVQPLSRTHAAPLPNCTKTHQNYTKKRQKARFLCGISPQASRRASTDSTLKSPVSGAFWAAVDAAQSPKRYPKPSHMVGGRSPWGGGQSPTAPQSKLLPRETVINVGHKTKTCSRANDTLRRVNDSAPVRYRP